MTSQNYVLGIVGSPNPEGRTSELVTAALIGAKQASTETELIQMSDHVMQMRAIAPIPSTRFNFAASLERAQESGRTIADASLKRSPFAGLEERLLWYDALPYLGLNRSEERRLLAALTTMSPSNRASAKIAGGMARADVLGASGHPLEALLEITKVYEAGIKVIDDI